MNAFSKIIRLAVILFILFIVIGILGMLLGFAVKLISIILHIFLPFFILAAIIYAVYKLLTR